MKKTGFLVIGMMMLCGIQQTYSQTKTVFPDIPGYKTLKCDFHVHTLYSDGKVWPTVRVQEAEMEGLDAIAVTDHIEKRSSPDKGLVVGDRNKSYELAKSVSKSTGVIVIPGGEITRQMPPGHWNAIFIKDAEALKQENWEDAFKEARAQEAFIFWNHPGWSRQQPNETVWMEEHERLWKEGYMMGIELSNQVSGGYYPVVHKWAMEKGLTMLGNTDCHSPMNMMVDFMRGEHRDMTLVFAEKRNASSIKSALQEKRTAVYAGDKIYGRAEWLSPLFASTLRVNSVNMNSKRVVEIEVENLSSAPVYLRKGENNRKLDYYHSITVRPFETTVIPIREVEPGVFDAGGFDLNVIVENYVVDVGKGLEHTFQITIPARKK